MCARQWIERLRLQEHPEGGWFVESFRDDRVIEARSASTAIYFLLEKDKPSHFHRIQSAEMWHFYAGDPLVVHQLRVDTGYQTHMLGSSWGRGEGFQAVVPAHSWFAAESLGDYSLVGCTVAPGFEFADFELAEQEPLCDQFPDHHDLIRKYT